MGPMAESDLAPGIGAFVAIGDSFTEGLDDPGPAGGYLGWADRVAGALARRQPGFRYANLAIRGKLLGEVITEQLVPGRWAETRGPTRKELAATAVLAVPLAESSVKIRTGPPGDDEEDYALDIWAGVLPAALTFGAAQPDPRLRPDVATPAHIRALAGRPRGAAPEARPAAVTSRLSAATD